MLAPYQHTNDVAIKSTPDEATILSNMFAKSLECNETSIEMTGLSQNIYCKEPQYISQQALDHRSEYEADTADDDQSRLLAAEYIYGDTDFEYGTDATRAGATAATQRAMPTLWECVKNAFTLGHR